MRGIEEMKMTNEKKNEVNIKKKQKRRKMLDGCLLYMI